LEKGKVLIVIPARYGSTRFLGKPLVKINGKEMVLHVFDRAKNVRNADKVIIATDDKRIYDCGKNYGAEVVMTLENIKSGTDRVWDVAKDLNYEIVVNLQGDEPFILTEVIENGIKILKETGHADITTPIKKITNLDDITNPNVVKVVFNKENYAIYFSRSPIPFYRDEKIEKVYYKHIGLYCFKKTALEKFVNFPQSKLEKIEKLEQLRALENNLKIKVYETDYESISIDTPEDLEKIKNLKEF